MLFLKKDYMKMNVFSKFSDEEYFQMLLRSVQSTGIDGYKFPAFPGPEIQSQFVGSSYESALKEAFQFYSLVKGYSSALGKKFDYKNSKVLDFGCGWGRFLRFFVKDISPDRLYGVDVDPSILEVCKNTEVPGVLSLIQSGGALPYPDEFFDVIFAYSVFTHLPESLHLHWMREISRVSKPGCVVVFTFESSRFLEFIKNIDKDNLSSGWHAGLANFQSNIEDYYASYRSGSLVYMPTGGGDYRGSDTYGDAVVPPIYIEKNWGAKFNLIKCIDDGSFWQAVQVLQKK